MAVEKNNKDLLIKIGNHRSVRYYHLYTKGNSLSGVRCKLDQLINLYTYLVMIMLKIVHVWYPAFCKCNYVLGKYKKIGKFLDSIEKIFFKIKKQNYLNLINSNQLRIKTYQKLKNF